ncbi:aminotransferase class IV [Thalassospira mesophila]|uniref:aminotransferase class IV n=1 Tax=Thalassospira mesophila TaxID=1293891 RepID=UPI000A1E7502|nr:aminotransferase class IV [Thalassospira mesophila]
MLWLNGKFYPDDDATISVFDRGFLLGDGGFETMRATSGKVSWLDKHLNRILQSIEIIGGGFTDLPQKNAIADIIARLCQGYESRHAVIRLTVSRGQGGQGLLPVKVHDGAVLITAKPFDLTIGSWPMTLAVSQKVRRNLWSVTAKIKSLNYLDNIIARQEAADNGAEDCLVLTQDGYVGETTIGNIFALKNGKLHTAANDTGIFAGLSRSFIIDWAQRHLIDICYDPLTVEQLHTAQCVFVSNALRGVRPVACIGNRKLETTQAGLELYKKIAADIENSLGR